MNMEFGFGDVCFGGFGDVDLTTQTLLLTKHHVLFLEDS